MSENSRYLHVYGQFCEHAEARLIGTRKGLEAVIEAATRAIIGQFDQQLVIANDGEGYWLEVRCVDDEVMGALKTGYISYEAGRAEAFYRERAFKAEAQNYLLRKAAQEPKT